VARAYPAATPLLESHLICLPSESTPSTLQDHTSIVDLSLRIPSYRPCGDLTLHGCGHGRWAMTCSDSSLQLRHMYINDVTERRLGAVGCPVFTGCHPGGSTEIFDFRRVLQHSFSAMGTISPSIIGGAIPSHWSHSPERTPYHRHLDRWCPMNTVAQRREPGARGSVE